MTRRRLLLIFYAKSHPWLHERRYLKVGSIFISLKFNFKDKREEVKIITEIYIQWNLDNFRMCA